MIYHEFYKGPKDIGLIASPKLYSFSNFIGANYAIPIKKYVDDFIYRLIGISTYEPADGKKITKAILKNQCQDILESCDTKGINILLVSSADYFKYLTEQKTFEDSIGQVFKCTIEGYEHISVLPLINAAVLNAQPNKKPLLDKSLEVICAFLKGNYEPPKEFKFNSYELITTREDAKQALSNIMTCPVLTCDIETTGLRVGEAEILTIAFGSSQYDAITIAVHEHYGIAPSVTDIVMAFLKAYKGELVFHNALFDVKHMIYNWWMKDFSNYQGLYDGIEAIGLHRVHDTMLMAYAELNSTERMPLGLKVLAKDLLGDWGIETKSAIDIPLEDLAYYNAQDCCGTMYVYDKYSHQMTSRIYIEILQPSLKPILKMMINGLPIDLDTVKEAGLEISTELNKATDAIKNSHYVHEAEENLRYFACEKYNATHVGNKEPYQFDIAFNPNSATQLRVLLFDVMGFEPIELTDGGSPKTDRASIKEFISQLSEDDPKLDTLNALKAISETAIIINTFITAFEEMSLKDKEGQYTLHGDLRIGGTQSGRLSSSNPNLQNLPSGSAYGKSIKNCFKAPEGWLFAFADFSALEDKVGAILSGDTNKTREFTENIDGHSMRAAAFFKDELEERGIFIDMEDPKSINRVKDEASDIRNKSKAPSFGMQYGCAAPKLQKMLKCSMQKAEEVYGAFHKLYSGLGAYAKRNEAFAKANGYIELAFGLQLKTPRIHSKDNGVQSGEVRSASNAATQSYGMLMNRAFIDVDNRLEASEFKMDIKVISTIHDAAYYLVKNKPEAIKWLNDNLIEAMEWQEDPILKSDVKIGAELDLGKDWAHCKTLNNSASLDEINEFLNEL